MTKTNKASEGKAERKPSTSYAIKQLQGTIRKIQALKMATEEELKQLKKINNEIVNRWIGSNLEL